MKNINKKLILFFTLITLTVSIHPKDKKIEEKKEIIGYIDLQYVFENSNLKDSSYRNYLTKKKQLLEQKEKTEKDLFQLKDKLQQKQNYLGYSEYKQEEKKIAKTIENYQEEIQKFQEEIKVWETDAMAGVFDEIINVMKIISEEENMPVIISRRAVIYGKFSRDMSQRAIDIINEVNQRSVPTAR